MDKLDSYGDNFRSIPICVPNETDKDAQIFKEKIANKNINSYSYFSESGLLSNENSQSSLSNFSIPMTENMLSWKRNALDSGDGLNNMLSKGRKKAKKGKKEKKEPKRCVLYTKQELIWVTHILILYLKNMCNLDNNLQYKPCWETAQEGQKREENEC